MSASFRTIRLHSKHLSHSRRPIPRPQSLRIRQLHCAGNRNLTILPTPPPYPRTTCSKRLAIDPITFLLAATLSAGVGYLATKYSNSDYKASTPSIDTTDKGISADTAQEAEDDMAAQMPPGRPGNLTPDQEVKLKEMWSHTLDIFGVAADRSETNGTLTPSTTDAATSSPDAKKKKKGRLSLFGKKSKDKGGDSEASSADGSENDKHGQTKEFQQALASQTPEQLREAFWSMVKHDHPDALLLRFLRARKWDVQAALVMLISTMHWRSQEMHVDDDIMIEGEMTALQDSKSSNAATKKEGADFMAQLRMGKSFLHGTDKEGRPCCYVRVRLHHGGEQSEASLERFTVFTIETARMLLRPPVDTATIVFDMTDFSMANMDYTPVKFMIKCFEANYPESLGSVLVYKAPWIFQGIWKIIKGWLDPVVAAKVHFASNVHELEEWIPKSQIMKELGGNEEYTYSYIEPVENENSALSNSESKQKVLDERTELVKSYESETISWASGEDKGEGRSRLAQRIAENYWRLDPFVRARSLYDRQGVIREGGKLDFYPKAPAQGATSGGADHGKDDELD